MYVCIYLYKEYHYHLEHRIKAIRLQKKSVDLTTSSGIIQPALEQAKYQTTQNNELQTDTVKLFSPLKTTTSFLDDPLGDNSSIQLASTESQTDFVFNGLIYTNSNIYIYIYIYIYIFIYIYIYRSTNGEDDKVL